MRGVIDPSGDLFKIKSYHATFLLLFESISARFAHVYVVWKHHSRRRAGMGKMRIRIMLSERSQSRTLCGTSERNIRRGARVLHGCAWKQQERHAVPFAHTSLMIAEHAQDACTNARQSSGSIPLFSSFSEYVTVHPSPVFTLGATNTTSSDPD